LFLSFWIKSPEKYIVLHLPYSIIIAVERYRTLCGSRKYPYPDPGGNWKFQRGGGVKDSGIFRGEDNSSQESIKDEFTLLAFAITYLIHNNKCCIRQIHP